MELLSIIVWFACLVFCCYGTFACYFITFDTLTQGLFSKSWKHRIVGAALWCLVFGAWYELFSKVTLNGG